VIRIYAWLNVNQT